MTLEEALEQIVQLKEELQTAKSENETLSQDNEKLKADCDNIREINQRYYNRLIMQDEQQEPEADEPDVLSCEEFAKTIEL